MEQSIIMLEELKEEIKETIENKADRIFLLLKLDAVIQQIEIENRMK